tara:strand:+ start:16 stop:309 length:294 start_codon:yes stop_codon:yes gene_type:complete
MTSKKKVFDLAKQNGLEIEGYVDRYWNRAECSWYLPVGKIFGDRHMSCHEVTVDDFGADVKNAKEFWTDMYKQLQLDLQIMQDCTKTECDYCGNYDE